MPYERPCSTPLFRGFIRVGTEQRPLTGALWPPSFEATEPTCGSQRCIAVPDDVSLIGFDDLPWMEWVAPSITTLRQPVKAMTEGAVALLLKALDTASPGESLPPVVGRFPAEFVERDSVRVFGAAGREGLHTG